MKYYQLLEYMFLTEYYQDYTLTASTYTILVQDIQKYCIYTHNEIYINILITSCTSQVYVQHSA